MSLNDLEKRCLQISYKRGLSHVGSVLTSVNIINAAFEMMADDDLFILSNGHAGLALYVVLEKQYGDDAEALFDKHGVHPNRDSERHISASSGSLGHGLPVAVGMALALPRSTVYCLTSDGEWSEGSMWEALRIAAEQRVKNLRILVNANGYGANKTIDRDRLEWQIGAFIKNTYPKVSFIRTEQKVLQGLDAHYAVLTKEQYEHAINEI